MEIRRPHSVRAHDDGVDLDRKVLADIAMHEGEAFKAIVAQAKSALPSEA